MDTCDLTSVNKELGLVAQHQKDQALSDRAAQLLVQALVISWLDYCNTGINYSLKYI